MCFQVPTKNTLQKFKYLFRKLTEMTFMLFTIGNKLRKLSLFQENI